MSEEIYPYTDRDITGFIYSQVKFKSGFKYLLAGESDGKFLDEDAHRYFVLTLPAIDAPGHSLPINYYLDKLTSPLDISTATLLMRLNNHLTTLKQQYLANSTQFQQLLEKHIGFFFNSNEVKKNAVFKKIADELSELNFDEDRLILRISELNRELLRNDVFDEISSLFEQSKRSRFKILFAYCDNQPHWLTVEIILIFTQDKKKMTNKCRVKIKTYSDTRNTKLSDRDYQTLCKSIADLVNKNNTINFQLEFNPQKNVCIPPHQTDSILPSAEITIEHILLRINGKTTLNPNIATSTKELRQNHMTKLITALGGYNQQTPIAIASLPLSASFSLKITADQVKPVTNIPTETAIAKRADNTSFPPILSHSAFFPPTLLPKCAKFTSSIEQLRKYGITLDSKSHMEYVSTETQIAKSEDRLLKIHLRKSSLLSQLAQLNPVKPDQTTIMQQSKKLSNLISTVAMLQQHTQKRRLSEDDTHFTSLVSMANKLEKTDSHEKQTDLLAINNQMGAIIEKHDKCAILAKAMKFGHTSLAKYMLNKYKFDFDKKNNNDLTLLELAEFNNETEIANIIRLTQIKAAINLTEWVKAHNILSHPDFVTTTAEIQLLQQAVFCYIDDSESAKSLDNLLTDIADKNSNPSPH